MSINTQQMYQRFVESESVGDTPRFRSAFVASLNAALSDMNISAFTDEALIEGLSDTIDLGATYEPMLLKGIRKHIQESGEWTRDTDPELEANWEIALSRVRAKGWTADADATWEGAHGYAASDE